MLVLQRESICNEDRASKQELRDGRCRPHSNTIICPLNGYGHGAATSYREPKRIGVRSQDLRKADGALPLWVPQSRGSRGSSKPVANIEFTHAQPFYFYTTLCLNEAATARIMTLQSWIEVFASS